ncbi:hypothetical protein BJ742DRAFT_441568 [Cladochytrium replicatum]|nr:hypothetical protein BJ742DRAFT_441568 [Cladochytrium replicatum]
MSTTGTWNPTAGATTRLPLFNLPQSLIDALFNTTETAAVRDVADNTPTDEQIYEKKHISSPWNASHGTGTATSSTVCATCGGVDMGTMGDFRAHCKTDWHRWNVQRKARGQRPVDEDGFEAKIEQGKSATNGPKLDEDDEISSIDGSTDSEEDESEDDAEASNVKDVAWEQKNQTPFIGFRFIAKVGQSEKMSELLVYRSVLWGKTPLDPQNVDAITKLKEVIGLQQTAPASAKTKVLWTIIMVGSGHFAGAVFDCKTEGALVHKTFHRYTTRRKQGGAQSSNDQSNGKAKSAGADLRRYNEQALQSEITERLREWRQLIASSTVILIRAAGNSRKSLFKCSAATASSAAPAVLDPSDNRIRTIPFTTKRPTFNELKRCLKELTTVRIQDYVETPKESDRGPEMRSRKKTEESIVESGSRASASQPKLDSVVVKILELIAKDKVELVAQQLEGIGDINAAATPDGLSYLHHASQSSAAECVTLLLSRGADPTIRAGPSNKPPYDIAKSKDVRDVFRRAMGRNPDQWDWRAAMVPSPLTEEMEESQKEKNRQRRKKVKEMQKSSKEEEDAKKKATEEKEAEEQRKKEEEEKKKRSGNGRGRGTAMLKLSKTEREAIGMSPEARMRLDREKRAAAAEARIKNQRSACATCGNPLVLNATFDKNNFRYCSLQCVQTGSELHGP